MTRSSSTGPATSSRAQRRGPRRCLRSHDRADAGRAPSHASAALVAARPRRRGGRRARGRSRFRASARARRRAVSRDRDRGEGPRPRGRRADRASARGERRGRRASDPKGRPRARIDARRRPRRWPRPTGCRGSDPAGAAVRAAIARGVERIMLNDPRMRLGEVEPLHQMRVGTRRLRSDLRTFRPLIDREWSDGLREELRWLGGVLGDVRDLDVLIERLHDEAGDSSPIWRALFERARGAARGRARTRSWTALRSARYLELLDRLVEAAEAPALTPAARSRSARGAAAARAPGVEEARARRPRSSTPGARTQDYHRVRVLTKRARYCGRGGRAGPRAASAAAQAPSASRSARPICRTCSATSRTLSSRATAILEVARANPGAGRFNLAAGRLRRAGGAHGRARSRAASHPSGSSLDQQKVLRWM